MGYGAASTGVSNMASGVGSGVSNMASGVGSAVSGVGNWFSSAYDKTKKAIGMGSSTGAMGGRRRRRKGGQAEVVGFNEQWNMQGPAVGGRRRRKQ